MFAVAAICVEWVLWLRFPSSFNLCLFSRVIERDHHEDVRGQTGGGTVPKPIEPSDGSALGDVPTVCFACCLVVWYSEVFAACSHAFAFLCSSCDALMCRWSHVCCCIVWKCSVSKTRAKRYRKCKARIEHCTIQWDRPSTVSLAVLPLTYPRDVMLSSVR